ncbi:MAG: ferrochelatase, partial [Verrucomicrobiales bacterium]
MKKQAVLLVNLGSPDSTSVADVRKYLREFLMDGRVLDAPWPIRFFIVHALILPQRPRQSAEAYREIWGPQGSPLVEMGRILRRDLRQRLQLPVELAMRYQNPSIENALDSLAAAGVEKTLVVPLFPHYAMSSYESALERVKEVAARNAPTMALEIVPPFFDHPEFIESLAAVAAPHLESEFDHLLFSFHGLPEHHLRKSDPTGTHCLASADCCKGSHPAHAFCYRAQCYRTVDALIEKTGLAPQQYSVAFQSRLGRKPWLKPYTDHRLEELAAAGVKKLLVICPAFVADCLETLEEIGMRGRNDFIAA